MNFCPRCGTRLVADAPALPARPTCPACGFIHYRNPLPVAACIVQAAGGIYLIRRRFEPGAGQWALPAGFIEHGEEPAAAAARETLEETGLAVAIERLIGVYAYTERGGVRSGLVIAYAGQVSGGQPAAADDALAVALFAPEALPTELAFDTHRAALRDWLSGRGRPY